MVIGSLSPDFAYGFGPLHLDWLSHRFLAGSFGFCLPVGLVGLVAFYLVRRPLLGLLPARQRQVFLLLCRWPAGPVLAVAASLLVGAWTHILLDSMTHEDGWLVEHLPMLQSFVPWVGNPPEDRSCLDLVIQRPTHLLALKDAVDQLLAEH